MKLPTSVHSFKSTTVKVERVRALEVSTADWSVAPSRWVISKVVRTAPRAVYVQDDEHVDLGNLNRTLRGERAPIELATAAMQEPETA